MKATPPCFRRFSPRPGRARLLLSSVLAALGVSAMPATALADEPVRIIEFDPNAYPPPAARGSLLLTGAAVTGGFYAAAVGGSYVWPDARSAEDLRIPIVGPWMKVADSGCADSDPDCSQFWIWSGAILTVLNGLGQAGGVGIMLEGLFLPTREPSASDSASSLKRPPPLSFSAGDVALQPAPYAPAGDGLGLGLVGQF